MPAVMNAANEQAVALFLEEQVPFIAIPRLIEQACEQHRRDHSQDPSLETVLQVDAWARRAVRDAAARVAPPLLTA
jgi:1-deoxy-D-xylulose-5-phosphate reductoisomerase